MTAQRPMVRLELEPPDIALVALALEQLIENEGSTPIADRAVVLVAYLRLQRHEALHRDNHLGSADPLP
ncbi:MAG: hypothetical protein ACRDY6_00650 [Acidimicrobiia bacterium]